MSLTAAALVVLAVVLVAVVALAAVIARRAISYMRGGVASSHKLLGERVLVSAAWPTFKAGDLLLFVGSVHSFTNSVGHRNLWSHVSVIVEGASDASALRRDAALYSAESNPGGRPIAVVTGRTVRDRPGTDLVPLAAKLRTYAGVACVSRLRQPLSKDASDSLFKLARQHRDYPGFGDFIGRAFGSRGDTRHCFEWAADLLTAAGLPGLDSLGSVEVCSAVSALPGSRFFEPPVVLVYDVFEYEPNKT